jgi:hypothetical protein
MTVENAPSDEKYQSSDKTDMAPAVSIKGGIIANDLENAEAREVFKTGVDGVEFRTVSWQRATIVFCKINFAMSILAIPEAFATLGSVGGSLSLIGFTALNVCKLKILDFVLPSLVPITLY